MSGFSLNCPEEDAEAELSEDIIYLTVNSSTYQKEVGKRYRERSQEMMLNQENTTVSNWSLKDSTELPHLRVKGAWV